MSNHTNKKNGTKGGVDKKVRGEKSKRPVDPESSSPSALSNKYPRVKGRKPLRMLEGNQEDSTSSSTDEEELVYNSDASSINEEVKGNPDSNPSSTNEEDTVLPDVETTVDNANNTNLEGIIIMESDSDQVKLDKISASLPEEVNQLLKQILDTQASKAVAAHKASKQTPANLIPKRSSVVRSQIDFENLVELTVDSLAKYLSYWEKIDATGGKTDRNSFPFKVKEQIDLLWDLKGKEGDWRDDRIIDTRAFCRWLTNCLRTSITDEHANRVVETKTFGNLVLWIQRNKIPFNLLDIKPLLEFISLFKKELDDLFQASATEALSRTEELSLIKTCSLKIHVRISGNGESTSKTFDKIFTGEFLSDDKVKEITQIVPWFKALLKFNNELKDKLNYAEYVMGSKRPAQESSLGDESSVKVKKLKLQHKDKADKANKPTKSNTNVVKSSSTVAFRDDNENPELPLGKHLCTYCGKCKDWHDEWEAKKGMTNNIKCCCVWANGHHNKDNCAFVKSTVGKKLFADLKKTYLPFDPKAANKGMHNYEENSYETATCCIMCTTENNSIRPSKTPSHKSDLINMRLMLPNNKYREVKVLLDTGAKKDYINEEVSTWLNSNGIVKEIGHANVCSAFSNVCKQSNHKINFKISIRNEFNTINEIANKATIINSDIDLILGRETIKNYYLLLQYPSQFMKGDLMDKLLSACPYRVGTDEQGAPSLLNVLERANDQLSELIDRDNATNIHPQHIVCTCAECITSIITKPTNTNFSNIPPHLREDLYGIDENQLESIPSELLSTHDAEEDIYRLPTTIHGPESLQQSAKVLLSQYKQQFCTQVRPEPAHLPPFELTVEKDQWEDKRNCLPARRADQTRQGAIRSLTSTLEANSVIQPSRAPYYSHAFVVPKPNSKWRFVVDYKNLNLLSDMEKWPIPNIKEMLYRLGDKKPKYFAVFDLTSGYYQAPISANSRHLTAFMTWNGVYEWLRLPMGLKGAPSYFQRVLSTHVLGGLINVICELYLDDLIIYGSTEEEFLHNLEQVLKRLKEYNLTLNPDKCVIGKSSVEYVGHTISDEGLHFKREKLDGVVQIPLPKKFKELKSFLGLANYFREHVRDHSDIVQPLNSLLKGYTKTTKHKVIPWTKTAEDAFIKIRTAVHECPSLFFMDDTSPIFMETDASDYGIGAYLYQVIDGKQKPIGFISKTFHGAELGWDTAQKEGYAIFYALKKWEYLLRDRKFTLKTDHDNLVKLKSMYTTDKKVQRWLTCFQGYDYTLEHIKGELNEIADTLSRLCETENIELSEKVCLLDEFRVPNKYWTHISRVHNSVVGHRGVEATLNHLQYLIQEGNKTDSTEKGKILLSETWQGMREHVRRFIRRCPCCQKMSQLKAPIEAHPFTMSTYKVMERLAVDFIERLTPDENGNSHILVIIDTFSRFVELIPTKDINMKAVAKALFAHMGRYGAFSQLLSDRGSAFVNAVIKELLTYSGTEHLTSTPYSKEENSIVERSNKEIMRHLRNIIFDWRVSKKWSTYLPIVQRVINSTKHASTGVTPAEIVFGNSIDLDRGIFYDPSIGTTHQGAVPIQQKMSTWMAGAIKAQAQVIALAQKHLAEKDAHHMATHSTTRRSEFLINSYVLVEHRHNSLRRGPSSKLLPFLKGPMRITNAILNKYTLQDIVTLRSKDYHISKIRPFVFDPATQNPLDYAIRDNNETYVVDKITALKGKVNGPKKNITLKVYWVGEQDPSWEPWRRFRTSIALQNFLRNHKKQSYRDLCPQNVVLGEENDVSDSEEEYSDSEGEE